MILVELVPRDLEIFKQEVSDVLTQFPEVSGINVPDVLRLENRSYTCAELLLGQNQEVVPHIRAIDNPIEKTVDIISDLIQKGLSRVLIISGDIPNDPSAKLHSITTIDVVKKLKEKFPKFPVYCGLDPYRSTMEEEIEYARQKCEAGADGFFTQPFFEEELADSYLKALKDSELFIGISPVLSERSITYWETQNKVTFPNNFEISLDFNIKLAKQLIALTKTYHQSNYLMPIKAPTMDYLSGIFNPHQ